MSRLLYPAFDCLVVTRETTRGFLWWKRTTVEKYYQLDGRWFDLKSDDPVNTKLQRKLDKVVG